MKILSWNCRGLSRPAAVRSLRMIIRENNPDIIFLSETKSSPSSVSSILNLLGFFLMSLVSPVGSRGGLALAWRPGVDLECFSSNKNLISAWCFSDPPHSPWILSCIYGPPDNSDKPVFWDSLSSLGDGFVCPWLCIGDLNSVLDQQEKQGGRPVASSSSCPFKQFIDHFGLIDLSFAGNPFTWCNNRQGNASIKERLDRGLASLSWFHLHPEHSMIHLPASASDHHPILLNTATQSPLLPRPFRFEEFWTRDPSCGFVISAAWNKPVLGSPSLWLPKKLKNTRNSLKKWNSIHFGNIQSRIKATKAKLDQVQQLPTTHENFSLEANLKINLDELLKKEEILWKSKSRESWLTCTDLNTKYFHSSTLIRRRSNAINFLKTSNGGWVSSRPDIGGNFVDHFTNLFSSSSPPIEDELLDLFSPTISEEENPLCVRTPLKLRWFMPFPT
jgi:hypothetical protein